ncbi:helix-turn-helix domain-containing protein [Clostridium cagae]|uniref:helix-turn-helix domain-containing protein n=1 Tax=Clostridium cagae TaxID=2080751 RepID=UPI003F76DDBD
MENNTRWETFNSIIDNKDLDLKEKGLLLVVFRYVNYKTGYANPSRTLIKKLTGIKEDKTLNKLFNSIIQKGFLTRESGKGIRSKYFIKVDVKNTPSTKNTSSVKNTFRVDAKNTSRVDVKNTSQKEKKIKEYIELAFIDDVIDKVKITQEQYDKLVDKFNSELVNSQILALDNYIANGKGAKYKDHYRVLNTWCNSKFNEIGTSKNIVNLEDYIQA